MTAIPLSNWPPPNVGVDPNTVGVRNGVFVPALAGQQLAVLTAQVLGKRVKTVFNAQNATYNSTDPDTTVSFRFHTSPAVKTVRVRMVFAPITVSDVTAPNPRLQWTIKDVAAGASTAQQLVAHGLRASGALVQPSNYSFVDQDWTVTPDTTYEVTLQQLNQIQWRSISVWELQRTALDTASDPAAPDFGPFVEGQSIHDADVRQLIEATKKIYRRQGTVHFAWSQDRALGAKSTTSASLVNVLDGSFSAWGANSPGFYTWPDYHGPYDVANFGALAKIPVIIWVYGHVTAGTGKVSFQDSTEFAWLRMVNTTDAFIALQTYYLPNNRKVDALFSCTGGNTVVVRAFGMYEKVPTDPRDL